MMRYALICARHDNKGTFERKSSCDDFSVIQQITVVERKLMNPICDLIDADLIAYLRS